MEKNKYTVLLYNPHSGGKNNFSRSDIIKEISGRLLSKDMLKDFDVTKNDFQFFLNKHRKENIDKVLIAGGDGTISRSINIAVENNLILGIIPSGTFNNFAGDLKIPVSLSDAVKTAFEGKVKKIDTAKVNSRYFINNSSIGLYSASVKIREKTREEYKLNKITAMILAMARIFYLFPMVKLSIKTENGIVEIKTPFVFIGNNKYDFSLVNLGARNRIDEGKLHVNYSRCRTRLCLIKIGLKALFGKIRSEKDLTEHSVTEVIIFSKKTRLSVSADGEIFKSQSPLKYEIVPNSLKVMVPQ